MWFKVTVAGFIFTLAALAQMAAQPANPTVYLTFFKDVANYTGAPTSTHSVFLNGGPADHIVWISVADYIGITSAEASTLMQIASLCDADVRHLDTRAAALIFESRMEAANEKKPSETIAAELKALEAKRVGIIVGYVEQLKNSLSAQAYNMVNDYVRVHAGGPFFEGSPLKMKTQR